MTPSAEIEPGPHWWTTRPILPPYYLHNLPLTVTLPSISKRFAVLGRLDVSPRKCCQKQDNTCRKTTSSAF